MQTSNLSDNYKIADRGVNTLWKIGRVASLIMVAIVPIQSVIFVMWPPPATPLGYFALFNNNWFLGLLSLDLLLIVNNVLLVVIYFALYTVLRRANGPLMTLGLILSLVGVAAYFSSNPSFEMLSLRRQYAAAATETGKLILLSTGQTMLAAYTGTAYNVYYILNAFALLIFSSVLLRSDVFSKATAYSAVTAGVLMLVPPTVVTIGLYISFLSLIPWMVWLILFSLKMFRLAGIQSGST